MVGDQWLVAGSRYAAEVSGSETVLLDISPAWPYNNDEERTTHAVAPQDLSILLVAFQLRKQPSLVGVAVAFFAFVHDDRDGIPSDVECNSHGPHLLSEM